MPKSGVYRLANSKKSKVKGNMMIFGRKGGMSTAAMKKGMKGIMKG